MRRWCGFLLLLAVPATASAALLRYGATEDEAVWLVESSPLKCTLGQEVPRFGRALFELDGGGALRFVLASYQRPFHSGLAHLTSVPPPWLHAAKKELGVVAFADRKPPFRIGLPLARRLLAELEAGMFPTFTFKDWADGRDDIQVYLSAVNLRDALGRFRRCQGGLLELDFEQMRRSLIYFGSGRTDLTDGGRTRLDEVARYVLAAGDIRKIELIATTDSRGLRRVNRRYAERRAAAVKEYLISKGVAPGVITVRALGETRPIASNRTASGRAENRRVELILFK